MSGAEQFIINGVAGHDMRFREQHVTRFVIIGAVPVLLIVLWIACCGVSTSLTAERSLHANLLVVDLVRQYVVDHKGEWPRSWQDLERLPGWPEAKDVRCYVSVDFGADPDKLVTESVEEFVAVQPLGPCYPYKHYPQVTNLLEAIRRGRKR